MSRLDGNTMTVRKASVAGTSIPMRFERAPRRSAAAAAPGSAWVARLFGLVLLSGAASAQAVTCRVAISGAGGNDGSSWAQATNLASALASSSCSEIWVAEGVYKPTAGTDRAATFEIRAGVAVYGGFGGSENSRNERDPAVHRSVLSGDIGGDDVVDAHGVTLGASDIVGDNSYHVVAMDGSATTNTVLDGFTLTGGLADDGSNIGSAGGGLICQGDGDGQDCSPTLRQLVFRGNAAGIGGGMACLGLNQGACSATLEGVTFAGNTAQFGGGMASAGMAGGHCTPVLHNITFSGNSTSFGGGAFANVTATDGGSSSAVLRNVTLSGNLGAEGADGGGAIFNWKSNDTAGTATAQLVNAVAWDNGPNAIGGDPMTFQHSILQNGCPAGSICTDLVAGDPKLGALQDTGGATPVRLPGMDSAALDAGGCVDAPATDQRGVVRPQGAACDVGAAEVRQARLTVAASGAGKVGTIAAPASIGAAITDCRQGSGDCSAWYRAEPDAPVIALILYPDAGNAVQSVSGCGGSLAGNVFTTAGLGADCTVEVAFAPIARSIGGTVTGLAGNGLVLLLNGSSALPISANGTFAFGTTITAGNPYAVTIGTQPSQPSQTCVMVNGSGTVGDGDVTNVVVHCGAAATYSVGGTLAGLATGASITLAINSGNELTLAANGAYAFAPRFAPGDGFVVAVAAQPAGQHCTLSRVAGTVGSGNVADVDVTCSAGGAHLQLGVTDAGDYARYGQVRDYFVTLANTGNDSAIGVAIGAELDPSFDAPNVQWACVGGAPGTSCTAQGAGGFADSASLAPGTQLVWIVRVPIRGDSVAASATFTAHAVGAPNASDTDTLVVFRDGLDMPYADGAGVVDPARRDATLESAESQAVMPPSRSATPPQPGVGD